MPREGGEPAQVHRASVMSHVPTVGGGVRRRALVAGLVGDSSPLVRSTRCCPFRDTLQWHGCQRRWAVAAAEQRRNVAYGRGQLLAGPGRW